MMATNKPSGSNPPPAVQEFRVRVPKNVRKKYSVIKFNPANNVDFTKFSKVSIHRENNVKEFNMSHDINMMPKFGAGSEYGRDLKDEARRKKYGMFLRKYNPEHQPWFIQGQQGKQARSFKGTREGGVTENTSYYVFTQCDDGAFEAYPVDEWYNFNPVVKYNCFNAEEAEEQFSKRDKTLNYFSLMVKKKLAGDEDKEDEEEGEKSKTKKSSKKKEKDFLLTEMDEWAILSEDEEDDGDDEDDEEGTKQKKKSEDDDDSGKKKKKPKKKKSKEDVKDVAFEESDDADEGAEVDYMTDTDSDDDDMYAEQSKMKTDKYKETGVEDEDGLRKVIDSEDEDENEENKEDEEKDDEDDDESKADAKNKGSESDSSGSSSDSDPENEGLKSALFMQVKKSKKGSKSGSASNSRSNTPTIPEDNKGVKRKAGDDDRPDGKKIKPEVSSTTAQSSSRLETGLEGVIRKYLTRKPISVKDLLKKLQKGRGADKEKLDIKSIAPILKKLKPEQIKGQSGLLLYIKHK